MPDLFRHPMQRDMLITCQGILQVIEGFKREKRAFARFSLLIKCHFPTSFEMT
jgi:hypothetical protein